MAFLLMPVAPCSRVHFPRAVLSSSLSLEKPPGGWRGWWHHLVSTFHTWVCRPLWEERGGGRGRRMGRGRGRSPR